MKTIDDKLAMYLRQPKNYHFRVVAKFIDRRHIDMIRWDDKERKSSFRISPLFHSLRAADIDQLVRRAAASDAAYSTPNFLSYHAIDCFDNIIAEEILQYLGEHENVELAYLIHDSAPPNSASQIAAPPKKSQGYLSPAPLGISAQYAWLKEGGDGNSLVKFVDIEQGWILDHESFRVNWLAHGGLNYAFHDHGAAVLGVIMMQQDTRGRGIAPKVKGYVMSQWRTDGCLNNADALMASIAHLQFGDIILLQAQVRDSTVHRNLWPAETQEATWQVIRLAQALGVIVIEAAGNGDLCLHVGNNLDHFGTNGNKVLDRTAPHFRDSGAIMVAASSSDAPHRRISSSNYGSRIDCYAWGENVATAGNFPGSSGKATDRYTNQFCGTSSAAAIIAGAAISVQSITEVNYGFRLGPAEMRRILSSEEYGTPSANGLFGDKIGVMPDLKKIIDHALPSTARQWVMNSVK